MREESIHTDRPISLLGNLRTGISIMRYYWKTVVAIYFVSLILAFFAVGPMSSLFSGLLANTELYDALNDGYDHTIIMDIKNNHPDALGLAASWAMSMLIPYLLWSIFYSGSIMGHVRDYYNSEAKPDFFRSGGRYFKRFLLLSFAIFLVMTICASLLSTIIIALGINPFDQMSENALIIRISIAVIIFLIVFFLLSIYKEVAKVIISDDNKGNQKGKLSQVSQFTFSRKGLGLGLLFLLLLTILSGLYFLLRYLMGENIIPLVIVGQLFMLSRIAYKFIKTATFHHAIIALEK